ncbi:MAG: AsmA2 domain-containing protein YhdP [Arsenophonus endosymbiont of Ceratovacuna japonica]
MKRLLNLLVTISIIILFIVSLSIIGLYFFLPKLNKYRNQLEIRFHSLIGMPCTIGYAKGEWSSFGPILTFSNVNIATKKINFKIKKIIFSLDIWRSLFYFHIHFRNIILYKLDINYYKIPKFIKKVDFTYFNLDILDKLFFYQFDYFTLKESSIIFFTPLEEKKILKIHELTWLNKNEYYQAQGFINIDNLKQYHNYNSIQIKINLHNKNGLIDKGIIYLKADNIILNNWLNNWLCNSAILKGSVFSFSSWVNIKNNRIDNGQLQLHKGQINWIINKQNHKLTINNLLLIFNYKKNSWSFNIPQLQNLKTDQHKWIKGKIYILYLFQPKMNENKLYIRINNIKLERLRFILPIFSFLKPEFINDWLKYQLKGKLSVISLDIIPNKPEKMLINLIWKNISCKHWKNIPSINHFNGSLISNNKNGMLSFRLNNSFIEYGSIFKLPLKITNGQGIIFWLKENKSQQIWSQNLILKAKSLLINGNFRYLTSENNDPILSILVGAKLTNINDIWSYIPTKFIRKNLINFLKKTIIDGYIDFATIIFHGNQNNFPFNNNGKFQIFVPLRDIVFKYQYNWPIIFNFNIDFNFEQNLFLMSKSDIKLGNIKSLNIKKNNINYSKSKLLIKSNIKRNKKIIYNYFIYNTIKDFIRKKLDIIKTSGDINDKLSFNIPLNINSNDIIINEQFYFNKKKLKSKKLQSCLLYQPINLKLNTINNRNNYQININVNNICKNKKIIILPKSIVCNLLNNIKWQSNIKIQILNKLKKNTILSIIFNEKFDNIISKLSLLDIKNLKKLSNIQIYINGNTKKLHIYGNFGQQISFNSQWQFNNKKINLLKGTIQPYTNKKVIMPNSKLIMINLSKISNIKLFSKLAFLYSLNLTTKNYNKLFIIPDIAIINLPKITFANQQWNNMVFYINKTNKLIKIIINSDKLKGNLYIPKYGNWKTNINYLFFNPRINYKYHNYIRTNSIKKKYNFLFLPNIDIYCSECWFYGYKLGKLKAKIFHNKKSLILKCGSLINSSMNLEISGIWNFDKKNSVNINGILKGNRFDNLASYYGIIVPIKKTPFKINFNLNFIKSTWPLDFNNLNGNLSFNFDKGAIAKMGGGSAGKILRFISFDALLRKLKLDFSDTFSNDFSFNSIHGSVNIKNGILSINSCYIDGLIADIVIYGKINLVHRNMNLKVIIIPEISAPISVLTAFAINPFVGAAIFAVSKILSPLWNKISIINYNIIGNLNQPKLLKL